MAASDTAIAEGKEELSFYPIALIVDVEYSWLFTLRGFTSMVCQRVRHRSAQYTEQDLDVLSGMSGSEAPMPLFKNACLAT